MNDWAIGADAARLHREALVWDMHGCLPLTTQFDVAGLRRYAAAGANFISLNVGFDVVPWTQTLQVLAAFRAAVLAHPDEFALAGTVADVDRARTAGKLAVAFDLEGANALDGQLEMIAAYHALGVRMMLLAYNRTNAFSSGCHDADSGLSALGRAAIREMNRVGMLVDLSHMGARATLEAIEVSGRPVIFSHSNALALLAHPRNISDEQIDACAAAGGVIGINGVGQFLEASGAVRAETIARHVDHIVQRVGPMHAGLGLDSVFDLGELDAWYKANPEAFPQNVPWDAAKARFATPELLPKVTEALLGLGYERAAMHAILGGNFRRVAAAAWGG